MIDNIKYIRSKLIRDFDKFNYNHEKLKNVIENHIELLYEIEQKNVFNFHGFVINTFEHTTTYNGVNIAFTPIEQTVIEILARNAGNYVSCEDIHFLVYKNTYISSRVINVHIFRIKRRLKEHVIGNIFISMKRLRGYALININN